VDLLVKVVEIRGRCPVYALGDSFFLRNGYVLETGRAGKACMHSLASVLPFYSALSKGVKASELGLSRGGSPEAYVRCPDPCEITGGGTVLLEITPQMD
jgi:uncharacterized repeat protein (TIGR04076 family)